MRVLKLLSLWVVALGFAQACQIDEDCSLNGVCTREYSGHNETMQLKVCKCDPGWFGEDCGRLDLTPAKKDAGYNHINYTEPKFIGPNGNSSWGGNILQDPNDRKLFHMFADQFGHGCGLSGWRPHSTIIRAESRTGPQGPYHYAETVATPFRHNGYVFYSPADRKYLMYAIGADYVERLQKCETFSYTQWPNNISVASASNIRGPWSPFKMVLSSIPHNNPHSTNPAPWPLWSRKNPTKEIILGVEDDAIFSAKRFDGQYDLLKVQEWNLTEYSPTWTEDAFLWRDKRGNWHFLNHWMIDLVETKMRYPRVGAHQFARDLSGPWHFHLHEAYNSSITYDDGSSEVFKRRERPKLYFSDDGEMTPLYLTTGVQDMNSTGTSHTVIQPIGTKWKGYEKKLGF